MMNLKEKREKLPSSPGVYLMKDSLNNVIYVGKSKNLKSRVSSYFQNSKSHSPKVEKLVKNLKDFEYILTDTEFEAFMLECKLIKEIKPTYNRLMKSPNSYTYIKIKPKEKYPDFELSASIDKNDKNIYLGPYTNKSKVEISLQGLKEHCKIKCNNSSRKSTACLNYSLGLCMGMCVDNVSTDQYASKFDKILNLLTGKNRSLLHEMEATMNLAAERFDFETAAKYRDYINATNYILNKSNVVKFAKKNKNIALIEYLNDTTFKFFLINGAKVIFSEKYSLKDNSIEELQGILKNNSIFYCNTISSKHPLEVGKYELDELQIIYSYLKNKSNNCKHVTINDKWLTDGNNMNVDKAIANLLNIIN
jgi:excinuclease ABC subunit C